MINHYEASALVDSQGVKHEIIEVCEYYDFNIGNVIKYVARAPYHKDGKVKNWQKAIYYLKRENAFDHLNYACIRPYGDKLSRFYLVLGLARAQNNIFNTLIDEDGLIDSYSIDRAIELLNQEIQNANEQRGAGASV